MWNPECMMFDTRSGQLVPIARGPMNEIGKRCDELNRASGARPPRDKRLPYRPPFQFTCVLEDHDCRQDLVAIQRRQLAELEARGPACAVQLALI
jgi:hypothetical protein